MCIVAAITEENDNEFDGQQVYLMLGRTEIRFFIFSKVLSRNVCSMALLTDSFNIAF